MLRTLHLLGPLCALAALTGCGNGDPKLYPLTGKVTLDGLPLSPKPGETAFVEFSADAKAGNTSPHLPRGAIGADGTYAATTTNLPGIHAGAWLARVVYQREPAAGGKNPYAPPVGLVAPKYTDFATSGLRVAAGPDNAQSPEFAVTKAR